MKKILISAGTIAVVAALAVGGTIAFYNDSETSHGNIFTAGSIDLKVDHTAQTYNGVDCKTCSLTLYSGDGGAKVVGGVNTTVSVFSYPAVLVTPTSITNQYWATHPTAKWIWATNPTAVGDDGTNGDITYTFEQKFNWWGGAVGVNLVFNVAADNEYKILLNGQSIADGTGSNQYSTLDNVGQSAFLDQVVTGENILTFVVTNKVNTPAENNTPLKNPGGLLYYVTIDRNPADCNANPAFQQVCRLWTEKNLAAGDTFFNFGDVKPADWGTNEISLHVSSNDAYSCLIVGNKDDQENSLLSPEIAAGDAVGVGNPLGQGELSNFLNVFTWNDANGNGLYDGSETPLGSGPLSSLTSIMNMDGGNGQFLTATTTRNIGLVWCAGTLTTPTLNNAFVCNGNGMPNIAQSDSFSADLTAYAVQTRNNSSFRCADVNLPTQGDTGNGEALGPAPVGLLSATNFAIVAKTAITDATPAGSTITGNIAIDPAAGSLITGLSCTNVTGTIYSSGGYTGGYNSNSACAVTAPASALAVRSAMEVAYADAAGRTPGVGATNLNVGGGTLNGQNFAPGTYTWTTPVTITGDITLTGDANDVWIFQIPGTLDIASGKKVILAGALAKNVFWQIAGVTTLGTSSTFNGTILDQTNIAILSGAVLNGRALAQTAVTLDANTVTAP